MSAEIGRGDVAHVGELMAPSECVNSVVLQRLLAWNLLSHSYFTVIDSESGIAWQVRT